LPRKPKPTLIVVDDDASVRRALQTQLQLLEFNVVVFPSAEELLAAQIPSDHACLLVDVYMPVVDGIELCKRLVSSARTLPTILMSGSNDERTRRAMGQVKSAACLFKPFDENQLLRAIRRALDSRANR
jgi:two-component system, LuxR family, response regulator FixJ